MKTITSHGVLWLTLIILIALTGCKKDKNDSPTKTPTVTEFVTDLDTPWQLAFLPDGRILVTERAGTIRVIENETLNATPYLDLRDTVIETGESGMLGIAVDPDFATNHYIYVGYTYEKDNHPINIFNRLVRYVEDPATKKPKFDKVLIDFIEGYINHNSGPIKFGPDGKIYWLVGERNIPDYAQNMTKLNGKILRLNSDGTVPADNPFAGSYVYTLGHRNAQGIDWQPGTNNMFNTEHGPSGTQGCCMDEINLIEAGKNYGWPIIRGSQTQEGLTPPIFHSGDTTTWAPAGATFIQGGPWDGSFVFAGLRGEAVYRAVFNPADPKVIDKLETYFKGELGRIRTVAQAPDGTIYVATSNRDGRGVAKTPEDDRILILSFK